MSVQKVVLCQFHCKARQSGVSLDCLGLENIAQVRGNPAEFGQNHDARKAVAATFSVLNELGLYFGLKARSRAFNYFSFVHFTENQGNHELV